MNNKLPWGLLAGVAGYAVLRHLGTRGGVTDVEADASLPGDEIIPHPMLETTHAISIAAPPSVVWQWLIQAGYRGSGRAGWYSDSWLDWLAEKTATFSANRLPFWIAVLTSILTAAIFATAFATPPRSGPFCTMSACVTAPYTDVAAFFPRDYLWMYPALLVTALFVVLMACIHQYASADKQLFSLIGVCFAVIAAAVLLIDYFMQLTVMQPSLLKGETEGLSLVSQYNPHGMFIELEALGYLMMSVAFVFAAAAFEIAVALLMLSKGRYAKMGLITGSLFLLAITPLGIETLPNALLALGLAYLATKPFPLSFWELVRTKLHQQSPRAIG